MSFKNLDPITKLYYERFKACNQIMESLFIDFILMTAKRLPTECGFVMLNLVAQRKLELFKKYVNYLQSKYPQIDCEPSEQEKENLVMFMGAQQLSKEQFSNLTQVIPGIN